MSARYEKNLGDILLNPFSSGYCCQVGGHCDNYSYCAGNRSGILCGQCKLGYCPLVYGTSCVECSTCIVGYQDSPKDGGFLVLCIFLYMLVVTSILFVSTIGYSTTDGSSTLGGFSIILFFYQNLRYIVSADEHTKFYQWHFQICAAGKL